MVCVYRTPGAGGGCVKAGGWWVGRRQIGRPISDKCIQLRNEVQQTTNKVLLAFLVDAFIRCQTDGTEMDLLSGLFIFGLYKTLEKLFEKGLDSAWDPVDSELRNRFRRLAGHDEKSKRRKAFETAVEKAYQTTISNSHDSESVNFILITLRDDVPNALAQSLSEETTKLLLLADSPNLAKITEKLYEHFTWDSGFYGSKRPNKGEILGVLDNFLQNLRNHLLDEPEYSELLQKEILRELRKFVQLVTPVFDSVDLYLQQLALIYETLDFVGIPEPRQSERLTINDIFVSLRLKREQSFEESTRGRDTEQPASSDLLFSKLDDEEVDVNEHLSFQEALKNSNKIVILGDPGAGKTTLLKYLTVACATKQHERVLGSSSNEKALLLPIYVPLREFVGEVSNRNSDYNLIDYFVSRAYAHLNVSLSHKFFLDWLDSGNCCIAFDGLDEVWSVDQRKAVTDTVQALVSRFPKNIYIVTSRIVGYPEAPLDGRDFLHCTVLEFDDSDIQSFVRRWYQHREHDRVEREKQATDLLATIQEEKSIQILARNPLLLTIIALVHRIEVELPQERVRLYHKCVTALIDTWEKAKGLTVEHKLRPFYIHRRRLLERLAYHLHADAMLPNQAQHIKAGDLEAVITKFLMEIPSLGWQGDRDTALLEAQAFVTLVKARTGLLVERGRDTFAFPHLTFQEYLASCDIDRRCDEVEELWTEIELHLHDPHWREVILLLLGNLNKYDRKPTKLLQRILSASELDPTEPFIHRHYLLAARALADRVNVSEELYCKIVIKLMEAMQYYPAERVGTRVNILLGPALKVPTLIFDILAKLQAKACLVDSLLHVANNNTIDVGIRGRALRLFGDTGNKDEIVLSTLIEYATSGPGSLANPATISLTLLYKNEETILNAVETAFLKQPLRNETIGIILNWLVSVKQSEKAIELAYEKGKDKTNLSSINEFLLSQQKGIIEDEGDIRTNRTDYSLGIYDATHDSNIIELLHARTHSTFDDSTRVLAVNRLTQLGFYMESIEAFETLCRVHSDSSVLAFTLAFNFPLFPYTPNIELKFSEIVRDKTIDSNIRAVILFRLHHLGFTSLVEVIASEFIINQDLPLTDRLLGITSLGKVDSSRILEPLLLLGGESRSKRDVSYPYICSMIDDLSANANANLSMDYDREEGLQENPMFLLWQSDRAKIDGRYHDAIEYYDEAISIDPELSERVTRGLLLSYAGRFEEALEEYNLSIAESDADETLDAVLYNTAVVMFSIKSQDYLGHIEAARSALNQPDASPGRRAYGLAGLEAMAGNVDAALEHLRTALELLLDYALDWVRHDVAWKQLRNDVRYSNLINETLANLSVPSE